VWRGKLEMRMGAPAKLTGLSIYRNKAFRNDQPLLLINVGQLLTLRSGDRGPRRGVNLGDLGVVRDAAVLCVGGRIVSVGRTKDALRDPWIKKNQKRMVEVDCET